jgi:hypothetical protein
MRPPIGTTFAEPSHRFGLSMTPVKGTSSIASLRVG